MHEISLIRSVINTLKEELKEDFNRVQKIFIQIGELSNVQPILLQNAFLAVQETETDLSHLILDIEFLTIKVFCQSCNHTSDIKEYKFYCEKCKQANKNIIQGEELLIKKIEYQQ